MRVRMRERLGAAAALVVLVVSAAVACAPEPEPTPTATGFATEEEAFAAAEATYRAYIDAENARRSDPVSDPDPQGFLVGLALESAIEGERRRSEQGVAVQGSTSIVSMELVDTTGAPPEIAGVRLLTCEDVSQVRGIDSTGKDITAADRPDVLSYEVALTEIEGSFFIEELNGVENDSC